MAHCYRRSLAGRLLVLILLVSVANADLGELRELLMSASAADLIVDRGLDDRADDAGSTSQPVPEVCDEAALAAKCAGACEQARCRDYPSATCRPKDCATCAPVWSVNGTEISNCTDRPCPGLWTLKGSHCYRVQNRYGFNFKGAQKYCLRQGGHLVSISSTTENDHVTSLPLLEGHDYWTSGMRHAGGWVWQQPDANHAVTWTNWNPGEPNNGGYRANGYPENNIEMTLSDRRWRWNDATAFSRLYAICEAEPGKIKSHCDSKPCMNGGSCTTVSQDTYRCDCGSLHSGRYCELYIGNSAWNHYEGHLYLVMTAYNFNRQDAVTYCAMHDSSLVSLNTRGEWAFIKGLLAKTGITEPTYLIWTGGYKAYVGSTETLQWADGTEITFEDWRHGEGGRSSERYIQLKIIAASKRWAWYDGGDNRACGFICEKEASPESRRKRRASNRTGMLRRLYHNKWNQPGSTMEY